MHTHLYPTFSLMYILTVGIGGSGRASATKLAAFMSDYELFQIEITKTYTFTDWREDVKKMMRKAGFDGVSTVFLFGDHQLKVSGLSEEFLIPIVTGWWNIMGNESDSSQLSFIKLKLPVLPFFFFLRMKLFWRTSIWFWTLLMFPTFTNRTKKLKSQSM